MSNIMSSLWNSRVFVVLLIVDVTGSPMVLLSQFSGKIQVQIKDQISQIVPLFEYFNEENVNFDLWKFHKMIFQDVHFLQQLLLSTVMLQKLFRPLKIIKQLRYSDVSPANFYTIELYRPYVKCPHDLLNIIKIKLFLIQFVNIRKRILPNFIFRSFALWAIHKVVKVQNQHKKFYQSSS